MGLANEAVPADEFDMRLEEFADEVVSGPTRALGTTTRLLTESGNRRLESQLTAEIEAIATAAYTEDDSNGLETFFAAEEPEFAVARTTSQNSLREPAAVSC